MSIATKLTAFGTLVAACFGIGMGAGAVFGPIDVDGDDDTHIPGVEHGSTESTVPHAEGH